MQSSGSEGNARPNASGLPLRTRQVLAFGALILSTCVVLCIGFMPPIPWEPFDMIDFRDPRLLITVLILVDLPLAWFLAAWVSRPFRVTLDLFDTAVRSFGDHDYSLRLAPPGQQELDMLVHFFNRVAQMQLEERGHIYQKELLLDTVIQNAPMGILVVGPKGHLIMANHDAQDMMKPGNPLLGMKLSDLQEMMPDAMAEALQQSRDALFTLPHQGETESYHLSQRGFRINTMEYRLIMIKRLTHEMRQAEVQVWKKIIRLINHELNNTLAPLQSLLHSARTILDQPERYHKLDKVFVSMENTCSRLVKFLQDYADFARLPLPRIEPVSLRDFFAELSELVYFELELVDGLTTAHFDAGQMQRVMLNLIKNAHEASKEDGQVEIKVDQHGDQLRIQVLDRGKGMSEEAMEKALTPFFSTKRQGTGLGLTLCREIMEGHEGSIRLQHRDGGGTVVSCLLFAAK